MITLTFTDNQKAIINSGSSFKEIRLEFPDHEIPDIENNQVYLDAMSLEESIFDGDVLKFGECNGSLFKIRVADFVEDINGARMNVYVHYTNEELGEIDVPFGKYIVSDVERTSDRRWRDITATDYMSLFDTDIAEWYNNTLYPTSDTTRTVKEIRTMLCAYIGVDQEEITLINDDLVIGNTIEPQSLKGRDLLKAICELNACFGHFDWSGVLKYITIEFDGLFPSETLYPSNDLYPRASHSNGVDTEYILQYKQDGCDYADYDVQDIDSVAIMKEDGDLAVHAEIGQTYTNRYNIVGNFLLYGFSTEELEDIAETILSKIDDCSYRPNTTTVFGGVYMEMGQDYVVNARTYVGTEIIDKKFYSYLLKRTITGIQAMYSTLEAMGDQYQPETPTYDVDRQLKALQGKSASISKDLEGLKVEYHDFEQQTNSKFIQTANEITTEVAKTQGTWLEEYPTGTPINIKYKNYGTPKSSYPNAEFEEMDFSDGDYYLDVSTGKLYQGTVSGATLYTVLINWREIKTLPRVEEHLSSSIDQTAESITLTVSKSTKTWLEEHPVGTPITIDYYGYGNPPTLPTSDSEYYSVSLNDLYLDGEEGKVYKCTNIQYVEIHEGSGIEIRKQFTWTYQYTLESQTEEIYSKIEQTAESITSTVAGYQTVWDEENYYIKWKEYGVVESIQVAHGSSNYPIVYDYYLDVETGLLYRIATVTKDTDTSNYQYDYYNIALAPNPIQLKTTRSAIESQIIQLADSITLEVTGGVGNTASIVLKVDGQTQGTGTIDLTGLVTFTNLSTEGQTTINGANIQTGTLSANKITTGTMSADRINGGTINGQSIVGGSIKGSNLATNYIYIYPQSNHTFAQIIAYADSNLSRYLGDILFDTNKVTVDGGNLYVGTNGSKDIYANNGRFDKVYIGDNPIQSVSANCYVGTSNGLNKITGSSIKFKHDFKKDFNEDLDPHKLYDVPIYQFKFQTNHLDNEKDIRYDKDVIGFITESLAKHYPIACDYEYDRKTENYKALGWNEKYMIPPMLKLIQEQHKEIQSQQQEINNLKEDIATLKQQVAFLMQGGK